MEKLMELKGKQICFGDLNEVMISLGGEDLLDWHGDEEILEILETGVVYFSLNEEEQVRVELEIINKVDLKIESVGATYVNITCVELEK